MAKPKGKRVIEGEKVEWDELSEYRAKESWKDVGLMKGMEDVDSMRTLGMSGAGGMAGLEKRWNRSWDTDRMAK